MRTFPFNKVAQQRENVGVALPTLAFIVFQLVQSISDSAYEGDYQTYRRTKGCQPQTVGAHPVVRNAELLEPVCVLVIEIDQWRPTAVERR